MKKQDLYDQSKELTGKAKLADNMVVIAGMIIIVAIILVPVFKIL